MTCSCSSKLEIKSDFYDNGLIKSKSFFNKDSIQSPYCVLLYNQNGKLVDSLSFDKNGKLNGIIFNQKDDYCKWTNYRHGLRHGQIEVHTNSGKRIIQNYVNDSLNGVEYQYDSSRILNGEILWVNDTPRIFKEIYHTSIGDTVFNKGVEGGKYIEKMEVITDSFKINILNKIVNDTPIPFASIIYGLDGKVIEGTTKNSYVHIESKDTILIGQDFNLIFTNHFGNIKDADWEIIIDNPHKPNKKQSYYFVPNVVDSVNIFIEDYQLGYNFIWGIVKQKRDTITLNQVWFYKDFYVKNE